MKEIKGLKPFTKFLMTIGELPSSYLVSMTYEEQLLWFCNYLQNVVIPTINNNSEAVVELQEFVTNYFENLDVQEEINNKLDDMAESGELAEIIAAYISVNAIFSYDTIADMAASEVLEDGSDVYCLGKDTYNDGKGAFYKIREITVSDVVDGYNIVTITNSDNLIGERLPNYEINQINNAIDTINNTSIPGLQSQITTITNTTIPSVQTQIDTINNTTIPSINSSISTINNTTIPGIQSQIDTLNNTTIPGISSNVTTLSNNLNAEITNRIANAQTIQNMVVIGDSYGIMDGVTNYNVYIQQYLGLDSNHFYNKCEHGAAFIRLGDSFKTFNELTTELQTDLTSERRNAVTHVLIAGGYNDLTHNYSDIVSAIGTCLTNAHNTFPNAQIYVAYIGWSASNVDLQATYDAYYNGTIQTKYGKYITNSQNILTNNLLSTSNPAHPNQNGFKALARNLIEGLQTGTCHPTQQWTDVYDENNNYIGVAQQNNNIITFIISDLNIDTTGTADGTSKTLFNLKDDSMVRGKHNYKFVVPCWLFNLTASPNQHITGTAIVSILDGVVSVKPYGLTSDGTGWFSYTRINLPENCIYIEHKNS